MGRRPYTRVTRHKSKAVGSLCPPIVFEHSEHRHETDRPTDRPTERHDAHVTTRVLQRIGIISYDVHDVYNPLTRPYIHILFEDEQ